jgi:hypothetical protein
VESSLTPDEVVASFEVAGFILMGFVVIPLVWSYLRKGSETDNVSFHAGDLRERENWLRPGEKLWVEYERWGPTYKVDEEWFKEQLEQYEERKKRRHQSQKATSDS